MSGHTKGPFEICQDDFDDSYYIRVEGAGKGIGFLVERIVAERINKQADAILFAAAPDLLKALEMMVFASVVHGYEADSSVPVARAAIAKARGEA